MSEWKEYRLKDLCDKITDGSHSSPKAQNIGYPMFSVKDMEEYGFNYKDCKRISEEDFAKMKSSGCVPEKDDILIAKDGSYLKQIFICSENKEEAILSSIAIFRPNKNIVEPKFLMYLLKSPQVFNYIKTNCVSGSAIPRIVLKSFKDVKMSIPDSIEEQRNIVSILSDLDDKIAVNRRICENLEAQAQALFKHWFVDFAPFKDGKFVESELGMIPEGWRVGKLEEFVSIKRGGSPRTIHKFISDKGVNWLKISDATSSNSPFIFDIKEHIIEEGLSKTVFLKAGELVLSNSATPCVPRFLCVDSCIHDGWLYFINSQLPYEYLYLLFVNMRKYLLAQANGSVFLNLKTDIVKAQEIIYPGIRIMDDFNKMIYPLFQSMKTLYAESTRLSTLRDTLLPKLMSGQIKL